MNRLRLGVVAVLMLSTALLLQFRGTNEVHAKSEPLSQVPQVIAGDVGTDQTIDPEALAILGPGDFLSRVYGNGPQDPQIGLFIGYFPTQRTGVTIHSPKNCLPGAGWAFESSKYTYLKDVDGQTHRVGEYVIGNGTNKQFVIYWYQAHGRSVASEYMAKIYMVADAIRMNRTDGALVRVITPIGTNEAAQVAKARAESFAAQLFPMLPRFIPN